MKRLVELDSLPQAEAPVRPEPAPAKKELLPGWVRCERHRTWSLFGCWLCAETTTGIRGL